MSSSVERESSQERPSGLAPALNLDSSTWRKQKAQEGSDTHEKSSTTEGAPSSSSSSAAPPSARDDAASTRKAADNHSQSVSNMAPAVQFDEQNLLASPSAQRRGDNASLPSSPPAGSTFLTGSPHTGSKTSLQHRKDASGSRHRAGGSSHLRDGHNHHRVSSRTSAAGSSVSRAGGSRNGTASSRRSRANPTIVTVPVWARDESPSPPHSPAASPQVHSVSKSLQGMDPLTLPAGDTRNGGDERSEAAGGSTSARKSEASEEAQIFGKSGADFERAVSPEAVEQAEAQQAQSTSPDRWWSFTLPQKYRSRLHEHHLRMAFQDERQRTETLERESSYNKQDSRNQNRKQGKRKNAQPQRQKRSNSDSTRSDASSSGENSDMEMQEPRGRDRHEHHHGYGLGAGSWSGMAAGLGASGLLNNRQRSTKANATAERDNSDPTNFFQDQQRQVSPSPGGTSTTRGDDRDLEKQNNKDAEPEYPTMSFKARMEHPDVFTVHQPATPGWASPWKPEKRGHGGLNASGYFPRTNSGRTVGSQDGHGGTWYDTWKHFLVHNPFVPLLFRLINIAFTSATLAVAIKLFIILRQEDAEDAVGVYPIVTFRDINRRPKKLQCKHFYGVTKSM